MADKEFRRYSDDQQIDYLSLKVSQFDRDIPLNDVESELRKLCHDFHPESVRVLTAKETGENFAYVNFSKHRDARDCMRKICPLELFGSAARVVPNISKYQRAMSNVDGGKRGMPSRGRAPMRGSFPRGDSFTRGNLRGRGGGPMSSTRRPMLTSKKLNKRANHVIYLGSLPPDITESELRRIFDVYGFIESVFIKINATQSSAFAFVTYFNMDMARRALRQMSGRPIGGRMIKYGYGNVPATRCVWIGNIGPWTDEKEIVRKFERCGEVKTFHWPHGKNYAYIVFAETVEAEQAFEELDGMAFGKDGKRVRLDFANARQIDSELNTMKADFVGAEHDDDDFDDAAFARYDELLDDDEGYGHFDGGNKHEQNDKKYSRPPPMRSVSREKDRKQYRHQENWNDKSMKKPYRGKEHFSPAGGAMRRTRPLLGKTPPGGSPPSRSWSADRNSRSNEEYFERNRGRGRGRGSYERGGDYHAKRGGFVPRGDSGGFQRGRGSYRGAKRPVPEDREERYFGGPEGSGEKRRRRDDRSPSFDDRDFSADRRGNNSRSQRPLHERDWSPESDGRGKAMHRGKRTGHRGRMDYDSSQRRNSRSIERSPSPERYREDKRMNRRGSMDRRSMERFSYSPPDTYGQDFRNVSPPPPYPGPNAGQFEASGQRFVTGANMATAPPARQANAALYDPFANSAPVVQNQIQTGISYNAPAPIMYPQPNLSIPPPIIYPTSTPAINQHPTGAFGMGSYSVGPASAVPDYSGQRPSGPTGARVPAPGPPATSAQGAVTGADPAIALRFPHVWSGAMVLKSSAFVASMYLISGSVPLVDSLLRDPSAPDCPALKISQRLRLDEPLKLSELEKRIAGAGRNGCSVLLATPVVAQVGDVNNVIQQRPLRSLGTYLHDKECAAVIYLPPGAHAGEEKGVMHAFPPCAFSRDFLSKEAPELVPNFPRNDHLLVIVMREGPRG